MGEDNRMMEDVDIASTFTMPALNIVEANPVLEQVPQPSERAQLSERDQTEMETQNDILEETINEQRETVETPQVQETQDQPDSIQVTKIVCI